MTNLVDNAIRHNLPGGWVQIETSTRAGHAQLSVANSGPAVPPSEIDRLLRPFQRLGTDRTGHREGHGLGLSIVAAVAAAHDADLRVRARPDGGLHVVVHFPTRTTKHRQARRPRRRRRARTPRRRRSRPARTPTAGRTRS